MAGVVREARSELASPELTFRRRRATSVPRKRLEPIGEVSPRPKPPAGPGPTRPRGGSQPPRLPAEREADEDAAGVLEELEAFGASLDEQSTALEGLMSRRAELWEHFEASRREVEACKRELDLLAPNTETDDGRALREALGLSSDPPD